MALWVMIDWFSSYTVGFLYMNHSIVSHLSLASLKGMFLLMRPLQWLKNVFVLAPLLFSGEFIHYHAVAEALLAMLFFCFASSAAYIVNDIYDIEDDRRHLKKSVTRPLAAGQVSILQAKGLLIVLYCLVLSSWLVFPDVFFILGAYILLNIAYTIWFKREPVVDIFMIAFGFVLRVYAGAVALQVPMSSWMFITTFSLALYLAAIKRRQELQNRGTEAREVLKQYSISLVERYADMSGTATLIFYSMFVMSAKPSLVVSIPLVLFGLFRYWYVVDELDGGESPINVLVEDKPLLLTVILWAVVCCWLLRP